MNEDIKNMNLAIYESKKANCIKGQVGTVIIKDNKVISTGCNSVPEGIIPCTEETCIRKKLKLKSGENQELCLVVHAEQNAIINALNSHNDIRNSTVYTTKQPCVICAKMLINAGVKEIVYLKEYPDKLSEDILKEAKIILRKLNMEE